MLDIVLNAAPGAVAGVLLGWSPVAVLAMAGVTYASSSGIVAKVLADLGRLGNRETPVVLSLLVLEDLVMALYLPVLTAVLAGLGVARGAISVTVALTTVAVVLFVALRFGDRISRIMFDESDEVLLLRVLGLALLVAGIAAQLQVSAAVGAFLVGIALSGEVAESARALLTPLRDLFAAVFFVFFGLHTDPSAIPPVALTAVALGVVSILTKIATGWWAAKRAGVADGRPLPRRRRAGPARRVQHRHRRARGHRRGRAGHRAAGRGLRDVPRDRRARFSPATSSRPPAATSGDGPTKAAH